MAKRRSPEEVIRDNAKEDAVAHMALAKNRVLDEDFIGASACLTKAQDKLLELRQDPEETPDGS